MKESKDIMAIRIKALRKQKNLSQEQLADLLGLQKSAIAKYENGRVINIKRSTIAQMAKIFNCSPSYIMGWNENKTNDQNQSYYFNPETSKIAQEIYDNKELSLLFDAARDAEPEDLQTVHSMLMALKRKEKGE
ncbi:helix-turn-helix domain-containing protein [Eubacterium sp. MSJ-13]|uniref:helix-turn-helix domain-containing protein n=1 Tax=Eubacterium sp. MSJ-13 TaxID=2841513 RepID=UPI0020A10A00|nr:helix-turn-helix transcriptional regulator [Eubacterium sp. MSJ-13]